MNIRKRSGNYQIREMVNRKTYSLTIDHRPTQKEAQELLQQAYKINTSVSPSMTYKAACEAYIEAKSNILSPSSIRRYKQYLSSIPDALLNAQLSSVSKPMIQSEINRFSSDHAPKTVSNYFGFLSAVLNFYGKEINGIVLPQKEKKSPYIPTKEEVSAIFNEIKGSPFEVPIMLSAMGLRRSEICALTIDDLKGNVLTVNKALVENENKEWVIKATKTTDSTRDVVIPEYLADLIRKQGYVYNGFPGSIRNHLILVQKKLGVEKFSLHKMRHFFASYMHDLGYTDKQIQEAGGWKTDNIMKTVYQHAMDMEEAKKKMSDSIGSLI
jgi:integrase